MRMRLRVLLAILVLLIGVALAQDPAADLPVRHPHDPAPVQSAVPVPTPTPVTEEPPPVFYGEELESRSQSVIFVLDTSGSMAGARVDAMRVEVVKGIQSLSDDWRFTVVRFSSGVAAWQPQLVRADESNKTAACKWVEALRAGGGTNTGPAVVYALALDRTNLLIVLLTDGGPNGGMDHRGAIRAGNVQRAVIDVFAIQPGNERMRKFCLNVAADNGGAYYEVW